MSKEVEYNGYKVKAGPCNTRIISKIGSGTLPKALRGQYTKTELAMHAIDVYLSSKGGKRAETVSTR
jgi:hypothetical protein